METILSVSELKKSYKDHEVLKGVSFNVKKGGIFALLGSNGAGKTTMINILATLAKSSGGKASICGYDCHAEQAKVKKSISLTGQYATVDGLLTGRENLILISKLKRIKDPVRKAEELLEKFNLTKSADKRSSTYSGGMRRRLDIAMSLIGNPKVIFLDEPTTGLDPQNRIAMWELVKEMANSGITIFLTTQYLEEAESLADDIAVLHDGKIVANGTADELKELLPKGMIRFTFASDNELSKAELELAEYPIVSKEVDDFCISILTEGRVDELTKILIKLKHANIQVSKLEQVTPTLEDAFLAIIGHKKEGDK
jgi:ABC-type multidrug transport system, ATPase component